MTSNAWWTLSTASRAERTCGGMSHLSVRRDCPFPGHGLRAAGKVTDAACTGGGGLRSRGLLPEGSGPPRASGAANTPMKLSKVVVFRPTPNLESGCPSSLRGARLRHGNTTQGGYDGRRWTTQCTDPAVRRHVSVRDGDALHVGRGSPPSGRARARVL